MWRMLVTNNLLPESWQNTAWNMFYAPTNTKAARSAAGWLRTFNGDPMSKVKIIRKVNINPTSWLILSLQPDEWKVPMLMSDVGYNWGKKKIQKYKSQFKITDARWVTHKYRAPPYKLGRPGYVVHSLGTGQCGSHCTSACTAVRGEWAVGGGVGLRERGHVPTWPRYTDMRRLTTGICSEKCVVRRFRRCATVLLHKPR